MHETGSSGCLLSSLPAMLADYVFAALCPMCQVWYVGFEKQESFPWGPKEPQDVSARMSLVTSLVVGVGKRSISCYPTHGAFGTEQQHQQQKSCEPSIHLRFVKCAFKDAYTVFILCISKYAESVKLPINPQQT